ncbi:hypothetical protein [Streptomyces sp. NPDC059564]|uniref:hypothetical protein n=1 Tax=Streptomyces sp. NPDC059564 TaxID=3346865 RepID=UPI003673CD35
MKNRTGIKSFGVPAGAALIVVGLGIGGWQALESQSSSRQASGSPEVGPVAAAVVGKPDDVATWRLPLEAYTPAAADIKKVGAARDVLIDACMASAGYPNWTPAPDLPQLDGTSPMDSRYGVHKAELAAKRGYHPDEAIQKEYDAAVSVGAVDSSGADQKVLMKCAGDADAKAPQLKKSASASQVDADSFRQSLKDPEVIDVFARWSSCMKSKGYSYATPKDAHDDPQFIDKNVVTELEIETAVADVACRKEQKVEKVWFDVETRLQQQAIKKDQSSLEGLKKTNQASVVKSSSVLSDAGDQN